MNEKSEQFDDVPLEEESGDSVHQAVNDAERALRAVPASQPCAVVDAASTLQDALRFQWLLREVHPGRPDRPARIGRTIDKTPQRSLLEFRAWCSPDEARAAIDAAIAQESA